MNAVAKVEQIRPSLIAMMASARNMDPEQFAKTVRATVMPANHTNEQFAALMLVASKYDLDPILKEIYAFPAKGGGIVPIVSIDGWVNLINSHPQFDGVEFDFDHADDKSLVSCTCRIYRKDRSRPVTVTEYLSECIRSTDPWKMKHRMLRHKALIQAARYAFGFAGIYDEDEGAKVAEMRDVTPPPAPRPPSPQSARLTAPKAVEHVDPAEIVIETGEATDAILGDGEVFDMDAFLSEIDAAMATGKDADQVIEIWDGFDVEATLTGEEDALQRAFDLRAARLVKLNPMNGG